MRGGPLLAWHFEKCIQQASISLERPGINNIVALRHSITGLATKATGSNSPLPCWPPTSPLEASGSAAVQVGARTAWKVHRRWRTGFYHLGVS